MKLNNMMRAAIFFILFAPLWCFAAEGTQSAPQDITSKLSQDVKVPKSKRSAYEREELQIPKVPSAPLDLSVKQEPLLPHCERYFVFEGKKIECDSQLGGDAERLRPIMHDTPAALAELDAYQKANKQIRLAAYAGSVGLGSIIVGGLVSQPLVDPGTGSLKAGGYITIAGIVLVANALIYGLSLMKANEARVGNAVDIYNASHPNRPILLQFDTKIHF